MIKQLYSVYDLTAQAFNLPFAFDSDALARRSFIKSIGDHPDLFHDDYDLYLIGTFDTEKSTLESTVPPLLILKGSEAFQIWMSKGIKEKG